MRWRYSRRSESRSELHHIVIGHDRRGAALAQRGRNRGATGGDKRKAGGFCERVALSAPPGGGGRDRDHVFPSQCEGSAKVTYEAAACGLPQVTTREAGDVVEDGVQGIIVPPADVDALGAAIQQLYDHPEIVERMSLAARERVVENFTWDHFRARLLDAYELAMQRSR